MIKYDDTLRCDVQGGDDAVVTHAYLCHRRRAYKSIN